MARSSLRLAGLITLMLVCLLAALPVQVALAVDNVPVVVVDSKVQVAADGSVQVHYERTYSNETDQTQPIHELIQTPARDGRGQTRGEAKVVEATGGLQTKLISTGVQVNGDLAGHTKAKLVVEYTLAPQADRLQQGIAWLMESMNLPVSRLTVQVAAPAGVKLAPGPRQTQTLDGAGLPMTNGLATQMGGQVVKVDPNPLASGNGWSAELTNVEAGTNVSLFYALERPAPKKPLDAGQVIFWGGSGLVAIGTTIGIIWTIRRERAEKAKARAAAERLQRSKR